MSKLTRIARAAALHTLSGLLYPKSMEIARQLESTRARARSMGLEAEFDLVWKYEVAASQERLSETAAPLTVFRNLVKVV